MCGLFGAITTQFLSGYELDVFKALGYLAKFRGDDSTGIAYVCTHKKKTKIGVLKDVMPSSVFFEDRDVNGILDKYKPFMIMGHARAATIGAVNRHNAHPINEKHIYGCHNGTIPLLAPDKKEEETNSDSRVLFGKIADEGVEAALKQVGTSGAYALTYIDMREGTFNIIRNTERPLYTMWNIGKTTMYWASERAMLAFIKERASWKAFEDPAIVPPGTLWTWRLGAIQPEITKPDVEVPRGFQRNVSYGEWSYEFCQKCYKREDFCTCHNKPELQKIVEAAVRNITPAEAQQKKEEGGSEGSTPLVPCLPDLRRYRGYGGVGFLVQDIIKYLHSGCETCRRPHQPEDEVYWCMHDAYLCRPCLTTDPEVSKYMEIGQDNLYKGELCKLQ